MNDDLIEYIPAPPQKPGCYLLARTRHDKRITKANGVTLLWLSGRRIDALALSKQQVASISRAKVA